VKTSGKMNMKIMIIMITIMIIVTIITVIIIIAWELTLHIP